MTKPFIRGMKLGVFIYGYSLGGVHVFAKTIFEEWNSYSDACSLEEVIINKYYPSIRDIKNAVAKGCGIKVYRGILDSKISIDDGSRAIRRLYSLIYKIAKHLLFFPASALGWACYFRASSLNTLMIVNGGYPGSLSCRAALLGWWISGKGKALFNIHSLNMDSNQLFRLFDDLSDAIIEHASLKILGVSEACSESLRSRAGFRASRKIGYIYNGIKDPQLRSDLCVSQKKGSKIKAIMLANYQESKGHEVALEAVSYICKGIDLSLEVYGYGGREYKARLQTLIDDLGISRHVKLNEYLIDSAKSLAESDILLAPSTSMESFGLSIVEAMALSKPVISTFVGGIPEVVIDASTGFLCEAYDSRCVAERIKMLALDLNLRRSMGEKSREVFLENFTSERMATEYWKQLKMLSQSTARLAPGENT